jgi:catechol-2,3-dioxygenase
LEAKLAVISLWAEDVPAAMHFYRDVIGLRLLFQHGGRPHFDLGGIYLVILRGCPQLPTHPIPDRFPVIAFQVKDLDAALERLNEHKVHLPWGIESDANSRWVMFKDPGGNLIEIVQYNIA